MTAPGQARPAVFLDRDGTLIEEREYLSDPDQVRLYPGVGDALAALSAKGYALVCLTNQSGVARGMFDELAVARVHARLEELLAREGVRLDLLLYAPTHPEHPLQPGWDPTWRKPLPGMFQAAIARLQLDASRSFAIGDAPRDCLAAHSASIPETFLVATGHGAEAQQTPDPRPWIHYVADVPEATGRILGGLARPHSTPDRRPTPRVDS